MDRGTGHRPRTTRLVITLACAAALSGCLGSTAEVPADHYYRFMVEPPAANASDRAAFDGVLSIAAFEGDGLLRDRPILFTSRDEPYSLRQHNYHFWADPPTRLIQGQIVAYLRSAGIAKRVVTPDMQIGADYQLIGRVKRLERVLDGGVAAEIEIAVIRLEDRKLLILKSYSAEARTEDSTVNASVQAMNKTLAKIFEDFRTDAARGRQTAWRTP